MNIKTLYTGKFLLKIEPLGGSFCDLKLSKTYLREANLGYLNLQRADFWASKLNGASFKGANLQGADLRLASLCSVDFTYANLQCVNFQGADLEDANFEGANLAGANLRSTNLRSAHFQSVDLKDVDLRGAEFNNAFFSGAYNIPDWVYDETRIVTDGDLIGWKKCMYGVIVKLLIPADAKRSNATTRKCRASYVKVLEVIGGDIGISHYDKAIKYQVGETVVCDKWGDDRWQECDGGIHFFLTREDAELYSY